MAKLIHLIFNEDLDVHYETLRLAAKTFSKGGELRLVHTFPPLVYNALALINRVTELTEEEASALTIKPKKLFQFVFKLSNEFAAHEPETGMRLWLYGGLAADHAKLADIAYEFVSQSMLCFEEYISDTGEQYEALRVLIGFVQKFQNMDEENFDNLRNKCAQHSSRLLKKDLSAKALALSAHLYWDCQFKDAERAAKCLSRAGKKANSMMDSVQKIEIFIELLNKYIYLLYHRCDKIEVERISQLISVIKELLGDCDDDEVGLDDAKQHFRLSCQYIQDVAEKEDETLADVAAQFQAVSL
jgi:vacuolar protein sorting-associated protein 35